MNQNDPQTELYRPILGVNRNDLDMKAAIKNFQEGGFLLLKGMFDREEAQQAAHWLRAQDLEALALKPWPDQEPGNPMSMYQNVLESETPISKLGADPAILDIASQLLGDKMYIWSSKVNFKAAWCGSVDYYHQDFSTYKERGYPYMDMMNVFICLDPHGSYNGGLYVFPGSHKKFIEHMSFINVNGLHKLMIPPDELDTLYASYGVQVLEAEPGDVLFFHTALVHGSSHNVSPYQRMVILIQLNTKRNKPPRIAESARNYNLKRAKQELENAECLHQMCKQKYELQLRSEKLTFNTPIPDEEY